MNAMRDRAARMHSCRLTLVRRSSSMSPIFTVSAGSPSACFDLGEHVCAECDLGRTMHLRLDHVDRAERRVPHLGITPQVMLAASTVTIASSKPSGTSLAVFIEHRIGGHEMADVAHQHQRPAPEAQCVARAIDELEVRVQPAREGAPSLDDLLLERALHQAEPVPVHEHLVDDIHRSDGILAVHDRGHRGLDHDIGDPGRIVRTNRGCPIDHQLYVETVMAQHDGAGRRGVAAVTHELPWLGQTRPLIAGQRDLEFAVDDRVPDGIDVRARGKRNDGIEERARAHAITLHPRTGSYGPETGGSPSASVP